MIDHDAYAAAERQRDEQAHASMKAVHHTMATSLNEASALARTTTARQAEHDARQPRRTAS